MNKCSYCKREHGIIGDTVCPIAHQKQNFYVKYERMDPYPVFELNYIAYGAYVKPRSTWAADIHFEIKNMYDYAYRKGYKMSKGVFFTPDRMLERLIQMYDILIHNVKDFVGTHREQQARITIEKYAPKFQIDFYGERAFQ